jgi:hypothetical protein
MVRWRRRKRKTLKMRAFFVVLGVERVVAGKKPLDNKKREKRMRGRREEKKNEVAL